MFRVDFTNITSLLRFLSGNILLCVHFDIRRGSAGENARRLILTVPVLFRRNKLFKIGCYLFQTSRGKSLFLRHPKLYILFYYYCLCFVCIQSKAVLVLLSLGKFYSALDMLYRWIVDSVIFYHYSKIMFGLLSVCDHLSLRFVLRFCEGLGVHFLQYAILWPGSHVRRSLSGVWLPLPTGWKEQYPLLCSFSELASEHGRHTTTLFHAALPSRIVSVNAIRPLRPLW